MTSIHAEPATYTGPYPPIGDYGLISDCHSAALVSRSGSIDWCCMPRLDSPSVFGRLLDWNRGGSCSIGIDHRDVETTRRYLDRTMVLETTLSTDDGTVAVQDCLAMTTGGARHPRRQIIRSFTCTEGSVPLEVEVALRFDYGRVRPWLRVVDDGVFAAVGGSAGMLVWTDLSMEISDRVDLTARSSMREGDRHWLTMVFREPEDIDDDPSIHADAEELEARLAETIEWWHDWCDRRRAATELDAGGLRSALVLKALNNARTGAMAAAATTSLPETIGGSRNWDYRYSWVRDSWLTVRSLAEVGFPAEADAFRRFVERSAAGNVDDLKIFYTLDGAHRRSEAEIPELEGYRRSAPVRIGNAASEQVQLDLFGYLLELAYQWKRRGHDPEEPYWAFIAEAADRVCSSWHEPDRGIWEVRSPSRQFVHSKVLCWTALDRAISLADELSEGSETDRDGWKQTRADIRSVVLDKGVSERRKCFVQSFGSEEVDGALLLLPAVGFIRWDDPLIAATVDAVIDDLDQGGLIRRYRNPDGIDEPEGTFVACTFWLVECLVGLGRRREAERYHDRATATANDLGLFAEEYDAEREQLLGNFPQGFSHLAHLGALLALATGDPD